LEFYVVLLDLCDGPFDRVVDDRVDVLIPGWGEGLFIQLAFTSNGFDELPRFVPMGFSVGELSAFARLVKWPSRLLLVERGLMAS